MQTSSSDGEIFSSLPSSQSVVSSSTDTPTDDWNIWEGFIAPPGYGKSTAAMARLYDIAREPAYCYAHDPGWRLPSTLLDGKPVWLRRWESYEQCEKAMEENPAGVHCFEDLNTKRFLEWMYKRATRFSQLQLPPSILLLDEAVCVEEASPNYLHPVLAKMLTRRRHIRLGVLWTVQSPLLINKNMRTLATHLHLFRPNDENDQKAYERMYVENVDALRNLQKFQYVTHRVG